MPPDWKERVALENEKRAVEKELEDIRNQIARLGGGHNEHTWTLQTRKDSIEARLQSIRARLGIW